jgi:hypothetical protein
MGIWVFRAIILPVPAAIIAALLTESSGIIVGVGYQIG